MYKVCVISAGILLVASTMICSAQAQTVAEAVRMALDTSPAIQADKARLAGISEQQVQAQNLKRPSLQLDATTSIRQVAVLQNGSYNRGRTEPANVTFSASQPLMLGGRYEAAVREADLRVGQSIARVRSREIATIRQVIEAYANVRRDFQVSDIRAQGVGVLAQQLAGAQARQQEGLVGLTEVSQVETRLATAQTLAANARARLQASWATLERLIGARPTGLSEDSIDPAGLPSTLVEAVDLAKSMSHDLKITRYNEDIARAIARSAEVENAPRVNLQASISGTSDVGFNGGRSYDAQIGARFSVPIWTGGQPQSRTRAALTEANAARFDANAQEQLLEEQVTQAWATLEATRASANIAAELVRAAQVARTGAEVEFDVGLRNIIEVLNQEQELQDARVNQVNSRANLMTAQANIFALMGLDPTGTINSNTQFDPTKISMPYSRAVPGKPAPWERPFIGLFDGLTEAQKVTTPTIKRIRRGVFGPEQ
jgi:TolC family type I secretion outer membrane protein